MQRQYQLDFSSNHQDTMYDREGREKKAKTMVAVLNDFLEQELRSLSLLDIGSSTGIIDSYLSEHFGKVIGIDIDKEAIQFARKRFQKENVEFHVGDSMNLSFRSETFDVVVCSQIYEHVPDVHKLISEIHRVLKKDGVCYFAATNRFNIMEPHYHLPFLSVIPRPLAHLYMMAAGKGKFYYEKHLSYWSLKRLVAKFELNDYTRNIVKHPETFHAEYMIRPGSLKSTMARILLNYSYWLFPGYIWILRKR